MVTSRWSSMTNWKLYTGKYMYHINWALGIVIPRVMSSS